MLDDDNDKTLPYDYTGMMDDTEINAVEMYKLSNSQLNGILHILRESDRVKYANLSTQSLEKMLTKIAGLKGFKKTQLVNICQYLNLNLLGTDKVSRILGQWLIFLLFL